MRKAEKYRNCLADFREQVTLAPTIFGVEQETYSHQASHRHCAVLWKGECSVLTPELLGQHAQEIPIGPGFRGHQIWVWGSGENSQPDEHAELELSAQMLGLHIPHLPARLGGHEEKEG